MGDKKPDISVYTAATQNGWKPLIFLEEAGIEYKLVYIDFDKREQKSEWFLKINPNGRIPAIVDHSNGDYIVMESNAILMYLADKYKKFLPEDPKLKWDATQWLFFQTGGVGPMMGQAMYFQRIAALNGHNDEFAIRRYVDESRRLLEVLNKHLENRTWMVGDDYSIVDMAMFTYPKCHFWAKTSIDGLPHLKAWMDRIDARPLTKKAMLLPEPRPAFWGEGDVAAIEASNSARFAADVKKD
mmetsp:Transcript_33014/g.77885  ORF Transcript_33014/g.77885 Transcript_33014/m.77885 type:complete len:242 (-) Transcript_33014:95-820(-)